MSEPVLLPIAHDAFVDDVRALALAIGESGWQPDFIVGIGRGGLVPGAYLSHAMGIALLSIDHSSGVPGFSGELLAKLAAHTRDGRRILIVDDINDSGRTLVALRRSFLDHGGVAAALRMAVLLDNIRSEARVDYHARTLDRASDKRWFVFPWEQMAPRATLVAESAEVPERIGAG